MVGVLAIANGQLSEGDDAIHLDSGTLHIDKRIVCQTSSETRMFVGVSVFAVFEMFLATAWSNERLRN